MFVVPGVRPAFAEVTGVTIASRTVVANGQPFGAVGSYEKLIGTIAFAIDPADARNARVVDLDRATRAADGRVHFTADLFVLRPVDAARGNGVLLFEVANRGTKGLLGRFNGAASGAADPTAPADFGDGFLMRQGYTLVWVGWEFDLPPAALGLDAPAADVPVTSIEVDVIPDERSPTLSLGASAPFYPPASMNDEADTLTVRDQQWERPVAVPRARWRFVETAPPTIRMDDSFEPGRIYTVTYRATGARVAGAGMAALRDAASAFRYRDDLPVRGRAAYIVGFSQSGRFLRQFLRDGFNADERGRRAYDAAWVHIAGAAEGSFNQRFAMPRALHPYLALRRPLAEDPQRPGSDVLLAGYERDQRPKVFYTNTSVEYWAGRAAALTHVSEDGRRDLDLDDTVRLYLLAGTQHGESAFPPRQTNGQALNNPTPQRAVMRALLVGLHGWTARNEAPPKSRYPTLKDGSLVRVAAVRFPAIPGVPNPRTIAGPRVNCCGLPTAASPLPHLVPQVDADGNEIGGIRVPEQAVPLATTTGWNFRAASRGNTGDIYSLLGSYFPFSATRDARQAANDPRRAIDERYRSRADYLRRIRAAADALVKDRYLLVDDVDAVVQRAQQHWDTATAPTRP